MLIVLTSCGEQPAFVSPSEVVSVMKPEYAQGFEVQTLADSSKVIVLFNMEKGGDTLQLIHWKPTDVKRIACIATTHISMIDKLGRLSDLKGVGVADRVRNLHARELIDKGDIINISTGYEMDAEVIYGLQPQLLFVYPFGDGNYNKYLRKGIGCVQISEYLEKHPLGRAEWIKLFGVLLNEEEKADSVFQSIKRDYDELKSNVNWAEEERPSVFNGSYDNGYWFSPPGNSFIAQLITDAGGYYIFSDSLKTGNIVLPFEAMYERVYDVDFWGELLSAPQDPTIASIKRDDKRMAQIKSVREGNVYYCNSENTDYHGDAVLEPQVILADLISVFHPQLLPEHKAVYYKKAK